MIIQTSSVTAAIKLKKLLKSENIRADIVSAPGKIKESGCSYAVKIDRENEETAKNTAFTAGIRIKKIFDETAAESDE